MGTTEYTGNVLVAMPDDRKIMPVEGEQYPLFVYGASKSGFASHAKIAPFLTKTGMPAVMTGAIMLVNERFPFIMCVGGENDIVTGELLTFDPERYEAALARADVANGIYAPDAPSNFTRHLITIWTFDRKPHLAWVYVAGPNLLNVFGQTPIIPSGWWTPETHREAWDIFTGSVEGDVTVVPAIGETTPLPALGAGEVPEVDIIEL